MQHDVHGIIGVMALLDAFVALTYSGSQASASGGDAGETDAELRSESRLCIDVDLAL
jgi:hypothetical protein